MDLIALADPTVFYPVSNPIWPQGCERPAGGRVDELLPGGLGVVNRLLQILPQDVSILDKTLHFLGDVQTYLLMLIHDGHV